MKEIIVSVQPDGSVKIEGKGFAGTDCDKAMKVIEDALGKVESRTNKPEYLTHAGKRTVTQ